MVPDPVLAGQWPLLPGVTTRRPVMWSEESEFVLDAGSCVVYLYELISLADSLFQLFLFVLQDRTRVFLPLQFLK